MLLGFAHDVDSIGVNCTTVTILCLILSVKIEYGVWRRRMNLKIIQNGKMQRAGYEARICSAENQKNVVDSRTDPTVMQIDTTTNPPVGSEVRCWSNEPVIVCSHLDWEKLLEYIGL